MSAVARDLEDAAPRFKIEKCALKTPAVQITNVLLRYMVQDDPGQSARTTEIVTRRLTEEEQRFVSLVTILEVVWVLKSLYKRSRQDIAHDIEMILAG